MKFERDLITICVRKIEEKNIFSYIGGRSIKEF